MPGVGLYTASAVLSIAHGQPLPVVDGNVRRVLARLLALRGPEYRRDGPYYNRAEELLDRERPGDWNQALMELGATVCTPRKPGCDACPLRAHCQARALGLVDELPEGRARRAPVDVKVAAALVEKDGRVLLVRRPEGRLLGGMWEVPQTSLESQGLPDLAAELEERHGLRVVPGRPRRARPPRHHVPADHARGLPRAAEAAGAERPRAVPLGPSRRGGDAPRLVLDPQAPEGPRHAPAPAGAVGAAAGPVAPRARADRCRL